MFKMTYVGDKKKEDNTTQDTTEPTQGEFTELTKYELQEGEEKEITIGEKKIKFKLNGEKLYWNDKEMNGKYFYVTNNFIITSQPGGQFGRETYQMYNFNGEKINLDNEQEIVYEKLRIEEGKLLADGLVVQYAIDWITLGKVTTTACEKKDMKKLSEYPEIINEYKNKATEATYSFIYNNEKINVKEEKIIKDLSYIETNANKICVEESN